MQPEVACLRCGPEGKGIAFASMYEMRYFMAAAVFKSLYVTVFSPKSLCFPTKFEL